MIGGVLLFGPFMLLGLSEFFDLIYQIIFAALLFRSVGWRSGLAFLLLFSASPAMKWEIIIQSDRWINAALVAASTLWFGKDLLSTTEKSHQKLALLASSAALAISLTYRASYMIILLPLFILATKIRPTRQTLGWILALIAQIGILLVITFLIFPTPYGPQHVRGIVQDFEVTPLSLLIILTIAIVLTVALGRLKALSGVLMWTSIALLSIVLILGISSTSWSELLSSPIESLTSYPPIWLESFGVYPLVASNAGILLLGLLALVWPNQSAPSTGTSNSINK